MTTTPPTAAEPVMRTWVIYHDAGDVELPYAAREWLIYGDGRGLRPGRLWGALSLEGARACVPRRFDHRLPRSADDDPAVVETWL